MITQGQDLFANTEPRKLARTSDPQTSKDAATKVPSGALRQFVLDQVSNAGHYGYTAKELCANNPEKSHSGITSRPNELEKSGHVFYRGDKRDGSRVIRAKRFDTGYRLCGKCAGVLLKVHDMICQSPKCNKNDSEKKGE